MLWVILTCDCDWWAESVWRFLTEGLADLLYYFETLSDLHGEIYRLPTSTVMRLYKGYRTNAWMPSCQSIQTSFLKARWLSPIYAHHIHLHWCSGIILDQVSRTCLLWCREPIVVLHGSSHPASYCLKQSIICNDPHRWGVIKCLIIRRTAICGCWGHLIPDGCFWLVIDSLANDCLAE